MMAQFFAPSDEEDLVRRTKHAHSEHNEESKDDVANGSETGDISSRYILFIHSLTDCRLRDKKNLLSVPMVFSIVASIRKSGLILS